jgi:hypothetical protein
MAWGNIGVLLGYANPACAGQGKDQSMSDSIVEFETEEVICAWEASDEALETAASQDNAYYTLGACTGLSVCPA